eukprot:3406862-Pyramimonas_sp.AAC.1
MARLGGMLQAIGAPLRLSGAFLGPSWTLSLPATGPVHTQGEGVEGEVNVSPKGKGGLEELTVYTTYTQRPSEISPLPLSVLICLVLRARTHSRFVIRLV